MASLTETYLMKSLLQSYSDNYPDDDEKDKNKYYNSVYLCIEKEQNTHIIKGFNCHLFHSFTSAEKYYHHMTKEKIGNKRHAVIPVCKYVPYYFHSYILNYKLFRLYWNNNITIYRYKGIGTKY